MDLWWKDIPSRGRAKAKALRQGGVLRAAGRGGGKDSVFCSKCKGKLWEVLSETHELEECLLRLRFCWLRNS